MVRQGDQTHALSQTQRLKPNPPITRPLLFLITYETYSTYTFCTIFRNKLRGASIICAPKFGQRLLGPTPTKAGQKYLRIRETLRGASNTCTLDPL
jgi:hypothetical protein